MQLQFAAADLGLEPIEMKIGNPDIDSDSDLASAASAASEPLTTVAPLVLAAASTLSSAPQTTTAA